MSSGGFPHIPSEWNRESTKTLAKNMVSKEENQVTTGASVSRGVATSAPVNTAPKKRRRGTNTVITTSASVLDTTSEPVPDSMKQASDTILHTQTSECGVSTTSNISSSNRPCDETQTVMRGLYHQVEKLARRPGCAIQEGIYLDSIMTHIPYVEVLQQMFGGSEVTDSACVPVVTRAYEESYMREVLGTVEQPCIMGSNCECQFIDEHNPFIGVQFTLPVDAFSSTTNTTTRMVEDLSSNKMCVLCCRKNTQSLFYEALYNHRAYNACIQLYGNICDRPGEYAKDAMLICPLSGPINNMPLPVVAHQRNRYTVVVHNGVRQLRQHRVAYEDFHVPSSSRC
jgi:hypothetical protein